MILERIMNDKIRRDLLDLKIGQAAIYRLQVKLAKAIGGINLDLNDLPDHLIRASADVPPARSTSAAHQFLQAGLDPFEVIPPEMSDSTHTQ